MNVNGRVLNGVVTFVSVVDSGSFRSAARALDITPSGVSRAIARLEEQLGVRLFNRHPRAVVLTDEGRRFHEEVRPLIAGIGHAADAAQNTSGRVSGKLRVQACPPIGHYLLAPRLERLLQRHPALSVELEVRDRLGDVVGDAFDVAIRFGEPEPSSLIARKLAETEVLTCASPAYLAKHGVPATPLDLLSPDHECIDFRYPHSARIAEWEYFLDGEWRIVPVKSRMVVNDAPSLLAACISGQGIAQPLALYSHDALASGALVRLFPAWNQERYPVYAYLPSRRFPSPKVQMFLSFVEALICGEGAASLGHHDERTETGYAHS